MTDLQEKAAQIRVLADTAEALLGVGDLQTAEAMVNRAEEIVFSDPTLTAAFLATQQEETD